MPPPRSFRSLASSITSTLSLSLSLSIPRDLSSRGVSLAPSSSLTVFSGLLPTLQYTLSICLLRSEKMKKGGVAREIKGCRRWYLREGWSERGEAAGERGEIGRDIQPRWYARHTLRPPLRVTKPHTARSSKLQYAILYIVAASSLTSSFFFDVLLLRLLLLLHLSRLISRTM